MSRFAECIVFTGFLPIVEIYLFTNISLDDSNVYKRFKNQSLQKIIV